MNIIFSVLLLVTFSFGIISCSNEDPSGATSQLGQVLDQPNSTDDENKIILPVVTIGICELIDNSAIDNSTVDDSSISDNSSIKDSTVRNCSTVTSSIVDNSSTVDNSTITSSTINSSSVCNATIDNASIDNSTVCFESVPMSIANRTVRNQIMTESDAPTLNATEPANGATNSSCINDIAVTFNEKMDNTSVTNTDNSTCQGTILISTDNFVNCVSMTGDPFDHDNGTFTVNPNGDLHNLTWLEANGTTYKIRVTTGVKDLSGNPLSDNNTTGFTTAKSSNDC